MRRHNRTRVASSPAAAKPLEAGLQILLAWAVVLPLSGCASGTPAAETSAVPSPADVGVSAIVDSHAVFRWGFEEGDTWEYRMTQEQSTVGEVMGQALSQSHDQDWTLHASVQSIDAAGNSTVDWTYTRIQMSTNTNGMSLEWDSENPDSTVTSGPLGAMVAPIAAMVGQTITLVSTPLGEILEVRGTEALLDAMLEELDSSMAAMMGEQFQSMFSEEQVGSWFKSGLGTFPAEPMGPGDEWTVQVDLPTPMLGSTMSSETRYSVIGFEERMGEEVALIEHEGSIRMSDEGGGGFMGVAMNMSMGDATLGGSTVFSLDRGMVLVSSSETEMEMTITLEEMGMESAMQVTSTTTLELVGPVG